MVIEFLADNPGWWFLHCHIDGHSNNGMAIAVSELPDCQTPSQNEKYHADHSYLRSALVFKWHELTDNICYI